MAALDEQLERLREDAARLQELLSKRATKAVPSGDLALREQSLRNHVDELRARADRAVRSNDDRQSAIDALSRRVAALETAFVDQQTSEVRALDDVITGMEQLLQLQARQMIQTNRSGWERHDANR